jgi:hypothetical protein
MTEEQKTNILNLIEALKTYPKTKTVLRDDHGFCCIGVLCELHGFQSKFESHLDRYSYHFGDQYHIGISVMPKDIFKILTGLPPKDMMDLMELNDNCNTFYPVIEQLYYLLNKMEN